MRKGRRGPAAPPLIPREWKDLARRVDVVLRDRRDADLDAAVALKIGLAALGRTFELRFAITERRHARALDAAAGEIIGDRCGAARKSTRLYSSHSCATRMPSST